MIRLINKPITYQSRRGGKARRTRGTKGWTDTKSNPTLFLHNAMLLVIGLATNDNGLRIQLTINESTQID